jgi:hypothetical protein
LNELLRDLHRVINFISIGKQSTLKDKNDEINALMLLQAEVFPKQKVRLPMHVRFAFGEPIDVGAIYDGHKSRRLSSILSITDKIRSELKHLLENLIVLGSENVVPVTR